ncbi:MAG: hypothetical protein Q8941_12670 [Bacteroidota bacterium]|nr:hypothetical protein [Bacteroidota bacterium]
MKQIISAAAIAIALLSCNTKSDDKKDDKTTGVTTYPYKATYSSDVTIPADGGYARKVLTVWKMFETNAIDSMKQYFADTVTYDPSEGRRFNGKKEDLLNYARKDIAELDSLRFDISMWQSLHVNDKNEDWVYIWAAERRYNKNGKADTSLIHEQWKIQNNKICYFNQYQAKPARSF